MAMVSLTLVSCSASVLGLLSVLMRAAGEPAPKRNRSPVPAVTPLDVDDTGSAFRR